MCAPPRLSALFFRSPDGERPKVRTCVGTGRCKKSHACEQAERKVKARQKAAARLAYLCGVHLKFSHDLDCDLVVDVVRILRPVDVAEGAVAHLLHELPSFEARIPRQFAFAFAFFGDDSLQYRVVVVFLLCIPLLLSVHGVGGGVARFCRLMSVIDDSSREVSLWRVGL